MEIKEKEGAIFLLVRVVPRAKLSEIVGLAEGALKVRIAAPPVEGKANKALIEFLADCLKLKRWQIEIVSGGRSQRKMVRIRGLVAEELKKRLDPFIF